MKARQHDGGPQPQLRAGTFRSASLDAERPAPLALPGPACSARATARCVRPSHGGARWEALHTHSGVTQMDAPKALQPLHDSNMNHRVLATPDRETTAEASRRRGIPVVPVRSCPRVRVVHIRQIEHSALLISDHSGHAVANRVLTMVRKEGAPPQQIAHSRRIGAVGM